MAKVDAKQIRPSHITNTTTKDFVTPNKENGTAVYGEFSFTKPVRKLGYICSEMDIDIPIFFVIDGKEKTIFATKGIYVLDYNNELIHLEKAYLPKNVDFIFDYETVIEE